MPLDIQPLTDKEREELVAASAQKKSKLTIEPITSTAPTSAAQPSSKVKQPHWQRAKPELVQARKAAIGGALQTAQPYMDAAVDLAGGGAVKQMAQGTEPFLRSGPSTFDEKVGGLVDVGLGGLSLYSRIPSAKLATTIASRVPVALSRPSVRAGLRTMFEGGWRNVAVPAMKGTAGAAVGGFGGSVVSEALPKTEEGQPVYPNTENALQVGGGLIGGALGGARWTRQPGQILPRPSLATGTPPKAKSHLDKAWWTLSPQTKNAQKTRDALNIIEEVRKQDPLLHDPIVAKREYPQLTEGQVNERALAATQKFQQQTMDTFGQMATPYRAKPVMTGAAYADLIESQLGRDLEGNLLPQSKFVQDQLAMYRRMPSVNVGQMESEWHEANGFLNPHFKRGAQAQSLDVRQDKADVNFERSRRRVASESVYNAIPSQSGVPKELMRQWGQAEELEQILAARQSGAYTVDPNGMFSRILGGAEGAARVATNTGKGYGLHAIGRAVRGSPSADRELLDMFLEFEKQPSTTWVGTAPVNAPAIYPQPTDTHFQQPGVGPTRLSPRALDSLLNMGGSGKSAASSAAAMVNESPLDYAPLANDAAGAASTLRLAPNPTPAPNTWLPSQLSGRPAAQSAPILAQAPVPPLMGTGAGSAIQSRDTLQLAPNLPPKPNTWLPLALSGQSAEASAAVLGHAPPPPLMGTGAGSAIQSAQTLPTGAFFPLPSRQPPPRSSMWDVLRQYNERMRPQSDAPQGEPSIAELIRRWYSQGGRH